MYKYYSNAVVCYVYLSDNNTLDDESENRTSEIEPDRQGSDHIAKGREETLLRQLYRCRWFTRGWTLQELIAPEKVVFYDREWNHIDDKSMLESVLERLTGIDRAILRDRNAVSSTSVAKRMSWAAHRSTTREEDEAYCLLGIFGVNMPLLYGEGVKAFQRLQEEIVRASTSMDHSILVWSPWKPEQQHEHAHNRNAAAQLFSPSAYGFRYCKHIESWSLPNLDTFELLPRGLRLTLPITQSIASSDESDSGFYSALLNCCAFSRRSNVRAAQLTIDLQERRPMPTLLTDGSVIENTSAEFLCDRLITPDSQKAPQVLSPSPTSAWKTTTFTLSREIFRYQINPGRIHITGSCAFNLEPCDLNPVQEGSKVMVGAENHMPFTSLDLWDSRSGILTLIHHPSIYQQPQGSLKIAEFALAERDYTRSMSLILVFGMETIKNPQRPIPSINVSVKRLEIHGPTKHRRTRSSIGWFTSIKAREGCVFYLHDLPVLLIRNQLVNIAGDIIWSFSIDRCDGPDLPAWMTDYVNAPKEKMRIFGLEAG